MPPSSQPAFTTPTTVVPGQVFSTTTGTNLEVTPERRGFDFLHFWHSLVEKSWIVALCVIAGFLCALVYLARTPKLYQGHVVLEVDVQDPTPIRSEDPTMRLRAMFLAS